MKKIKLLTIAVCAAAIIALCGSTVTMVSAAQAPDFSAPSVVLADAGTGTVLFEHNGKEHRPIASMVKIMTLLLVFENAEFFARHDDTECFSLGKRKNHVTGPAQIPSVHYIDDALAPEFGIRSFH